jgi:hypothetical protein
MATSRGPHLQITWRSSTLTTSTFRPCSADRCRTKPVQSAAFPSPALSVAVTFQPSPAQPHLIGTIFRRTMAISSGPVGQQYNLGPEGLRVGVRNQLITGLSRQAGMLVLRRPPRPADGQQREAGVVILGASTSTHQPQRTVSPRTPPDPVRAGTFQYSAASGFVTSSVEEPGAKSRE